MSAFDFMINMGQEGHLGTHDEQIAELRAIVYNLHKWVVHLNNELEKTKLHQDARPQLQSYTER